MLTRVRSDKFGNPRYVCHFSDLLNHDECYSSDVSIQDKYNLALEKSRAIGGKKYNNKSYGGGVVFSTYDDKKLEQQIMKIASK